MQNDQPASIPVAAAAFVATIAPALGYFLALPSEGVIVLAALINTAGALVLAVYLNRHTTSVAAPVVPSGTAVRLEGTDETVTVESNGA